MVLSWRYTGKSKEHVQRLSGVWQGLSIAPNVWVEQTRPLMDSAMNPDAARSRGKIPKEDWEAWTLNKNIYFLMNPVVTRGLEMGIEPVEM
jgi:hypothetical protein